MIIYFKQWIDVGHKVGLECFSKDKCDTFKTLIRLFFYAVHCKNERMIGIFDCSAHFYERNSICIAE